MNPPPRIEPSEEEFRLEEHDPGVKYSNLFIIAMQTTFLLLCMIHYIT
jgi:hypothetical protein